MKHLTSLFHLLEITRNQPQTGYAIWGGNVRMGNLAEHHYVVLMYAWQLAVSANNSGACLDLRKVFEFAATHDLGELFGGDISMPYAKANPQAREYAKKFEAENQKFIARLFGGQSEHIKEITEEILAADSDEARLVKVADYLEVTHYKFFIGRFVHADLTLVAGKIDAMISGMKDAYAVSHLRCFIAEWRKEMSRLVSYPDTIQEIINSQ